MQIAFIVDEFPSVSQTFVLNQIVGLIERGHGVDIYAYSVNGEGVEHGDVARYRLRERTHRLTCPRNHWTRSVTALRLLTAHKNRRPSLLGALNVARYGRRALSLSLLCEIAPFLRPYDIVHCQFGHNGNFGAILKQLGLQRKLVVTFHGWDIRAGLASRGTMYRDLWREADGILAISNYNRRHLVAFGADPQKLIDHPVGIDCRRFPWRPAAANVGAIRLLTVARLVQEKGLLIGLEAVAEFCRALRATKITYDIIGEGPLRAKIEGAIDALGLCRQVRLRGALPQQAVIDAMSEADIFLLPSLAEALPLALMEAQAIGMPVVATRVGSVGQIIQDGVGGLLVAPNNAAALAGALRTLAARRARWPFMARAARAHVEAHFDVEQLNDRLVGIYELLLKGSRVPCAPERNFYQ